jgi:hypothetical protein
VAESLADSAYAVAETNADSVDHTESVTITVTVINATPVTVGVIDAAAVAY